MDVVIEAIEPFLKSLQVPHEPFEIVGMLINFRSANSGTPYALFLAKVMPKFSVNFGMTFAKQ